MCTPTSNKDSDTIQEDPIRYIHEDPIPTQSWPPESFDVASGKWKFWLKFSKTADFWITQFSSDFWKKYAAVSKGM